MTSIFHPQSPNGSGTMLPWFWLVGIPAAALTLLALTWAWCKTEEVQPAPQPVHSWRVQFSNASADVQVAGFNGTYYPDQLLFAPPAETFSCLPLPCGAKGTWTALESAWRTSGGRFEESNTIVTPTRPGLYRLVWSRAQPDGAKRCLNVMVLHAAVHESKGNRTHVRVLRQHIGTYGNPETSGTERIVQHASRYQPPKYFAVLDRQTLDLNVGRNLKLGQLVGFIDRRGKDGRKIYTQERHTNVLPPSKDLCDKLSLLLERLQAQGFNVSRFYITTVFRTPAYNRSIGGATYSRHCYGDAVDLAIDEDGDHRMDDLNRDGRSNRLDGLIIAKASLDLEQEGLVEAGGIGVYEWDARDSVGSHVHIDCRGHTARWGQISRGRKKIGYDWWSTLER